MARLRNLTQHNKFVEPQLERTHAGFSISGLGYIPPESNILVSNCTFNGISSGTFQIRDNQITFTEAPSPALEIYEISNDILFIKNGSTIELIPFLQNCYHKIKNFTKAVYQKIENS